MVASVGLACRSATHNHSLAALGAGSAVLARHGSQIHSPEALVVSKRTRNLASQTEQAANPPLARTESSTHRDRVKTVAWTVVFVVLGGLYAVFFYRVPIQ